MIVKCCWCFKEHVPAVPDTTTQGLDCAAMVWKTPNGQWLLQGCYGSRKYDMEEYVFVRDEPQGPADPVCDACIDRLVSAGSIVLSRSNVL